MKRIFLVLLILILGLIIYGHDNLLPFYEKVSAKIRAVVNTREVNFSGLSLLTQPSVEELLPVQDNFWWIFNQSEIVAVLLQEPLIEDVLLSRCSWYSFRCFNVAVKERIPKFLYHTNGGYWLVGQDGGFIYTLEAFRQLSESQRLKITDLNTAILLIEDQGNNILSPDILKSRLLYVDSGISEIEKIVPATVKKVEILKDGELEVYFEEFGFSVRFDVDDENMERLKEEAIRLKSLLPQLQSRQEAIKRIDLAFDKVGVIQLN